MDRRVRRQCRLGGASVPAGPSKSAVNVFQEAEKIMRARQKPRSRLGTTKPLPLTESTAEGTSLSMILNREPAQTMSSFS